MSASPPTRRTTNDYPNLGVGPDRYYVSYNIFNNAQTFAGSKVCAFDRAKMLAGQAATFQKFTVTGLPNSGFELVLPGAPPLRKDVWVNAPVTERFVQETPYLFRGDDLLDRRTGEAYAVRIPAEPPWYERPTSSGKLMRQVGVMQGTYLAIYVGVSCTFWRQ